MSAAPEHEHEGSAIEQVFAGGIPQRVGFFRYLFDEDKWEWSPEVELIHGYQPGTANPTTELVLSHKHPEDVEQVSATLKDIRRSHKPFSTRHRIVTTAGNTREVVVIGESVLDESGEAVGTQGFYIDATPRDDAREAQITERIAEITEARAAIEQAKGILMFIYDIDADAAFGLLRWRSQETNSKLRDLAERLLVDVRTLQKDPESATSRLAFDQLLLNLHRTP